MHRFSLATKRWDKLIGRILISNHYISIHNGCATFDRLFASVVCSLTLRAMLSLAVAQTINVLVCGKSSAKQRYIYVWIHRLTIRASSYSDNNFMQTCYFSWCTVSLHDASIVLWIYRKTFICIMQVSFSCMWNLNLILMRILGNSPSFVGVLYANFRLRNSVESSFDHFPNLSGVKWLNFVFKLTIDLCILCEIIKNGK